MTIFLLHLRLGVYLFHFFLHVWYFPARLDRKLLETIQTWRRACWRNLLPGGMEYSNMAFIHEFAPWLFCQLSKSQSPWPMVHYPWGIPWARIPLCSCHFHMLQHLSL